MAIRNKRDFWSGVMFIVTGVLFMLFSQQYQMGTAAKMGPAYFPTVLGGLMAFLGLLLAVPSVRASAPATHIEPFKFKVILTILAAVAGYAIALPTLGFIVALFLLVIVSSFAFVLIWSIWATFADSFVQAKVAVMRSAIV